MRIRRNLAYCFYTAVVLGLMATLLPALPAQAQARVNDKDMTALMRNLRDDAKSFRPAFDAAIKKSAVRKTSQAKDARELAAAFEKQTESMLNRFKKHKEATVDLNRVESSAKELDGIVRSLNLGQEADQRWAKVRSELNRVQAAYGGSSPLE